MFQFPKQAEFNRALPKSKIYAFAKPTRAVKDRIVSGIQNIVWRYKLAPETVNLPARHGIHEIQVFEVALKTEELAEEVLRTIDKAVPSPLIYQIPIGNRVRFSAAYKRLPIDENGPLKAVGFHAGVKHLGLDSDLPEDTTLAGYGGAELQLPLRCYLVGEVTSKDDDFNRHTPYAYGLQWRAAGIAMSFAGIQDGSREDASFFYGIGFGGKL